MKVAARNYEFVPEDKEFNSVVSLKGYSYMKRCEFVSRISSYIIFDTIQEGIGNKIFVERLLGSHPKGILIINDIIKKHKKRKAKN